MSKHLSSDEILEMLSAYALRSLSSVEADDVRREVDAMTTDERNLLNDYEAVVGMLGYIVNSVDPPDFLESTIMEKISKEVAGNNKSELFSYVGANEGAWQQLFDGISIKLLGVDKAAGTRTPAGGNLWV